MAELQAALADQAAAGAVSAAASDNYDLAFQDCKARNANWEGECNRAWEE
jgi:hypothetical protein